MNDRWQGLRDQVYGSDGAFTAPRAAQSGGSGGAAAEAEGEEPHGSRAFACLRGHKDKAENVELRLLDPALPDQSLEYSLRRRQLWEKKKGSITIEFVTGVKAHIRGVGLADLRERLRLRRVTWVQEQGDDPVAMKEAELAARERREPFVWVTRIEIEEESEEKEAAEG